MDLACGFGLLIPAVGKGKTCKIFKQGDMT